MIFRVWLVELLLVMMICYCFLMGKWVFRKVCNCFICWIKVGFLFSIGMVMLKVFMCMGLVISGEDK